MIELAKAENLREDVPLVQSVDVVALEDDLKANDAKNNDAIAPEGKSSVDMRRVLILSRMKPLRSRPKIF